MKIKIIKGEHWYTDRVGEIFDVGQHNKVGQWKVIKGSEKDFPIYKVHTITVEEIEKGCVTCKNGTRNKGCMCWDQQCTHGIWEKWKPVYKEKVIKECINCKHDYYATEKDDYCTSCKMHSEWEPIEKEIVKKCSNCGYVKPCNRCRNFDNYPHWIQNEQSVKIDELVKLSNEPIDDIQWISKEDIKKFIKTVKHTKVEENNNLIGNNIVNKESLLKSIKEKIKFLEIDFIYIDTELSVLRELAGEIENNKYNEKL